MLRLARGLDRERKERTSQPDSERSRADKLRKRLANLGIADQDVADAVEWSRETPRPSSEPAA